MIFATPDSNDVDVVAVTGKGPAPDAWRIPLLGGTPRQLLDHVVSAIGWSPDGRTMAFVRSDGESSDMVVVLADADGSNPRELARRRGPKRFYGVLTGFAGGPPSRPAWSPDGASLALTGYSWDSVVTNSELVILDARTGAERRTVSMQGVWSEVAWLNDLQFLFIGRAGIVPDAGTSALWISDIDGRHLARVTREFGFFMNLSLTGDRTTAVAKKFTRLSSIWVSGPSGLEPKVKVPASPAGAALPSPDTSGGVTYVAFKADGSAGVYHLPHNATAPSQIVERTAPPFAGRFYDISADGRTIVYVDFQPPFGCFACRTTAPSGGR